ncbi:dolichyl-phosphate beta-glucosyltransferase [Sedimentisphaera cyanobacteriorum]|uniref:dolichyl-phosphate beta-glucosyltransferase n=1 Tax=Sedimentisphaera cyanobacteriorum TaxID=1940790 RepID=UPI001373504C|nr:dolichyl-phosphate beta-glucosyltransferase [Sedimentisphaera cyanobacteriorum]
MHQSMSFEVVMQYLHFMSPLLPEKTFESEFLERETRIKSEKISLWLHSRVLGVYLICSLAGLLVSILYSSPVFSVFFAVSAAAALLTAVLRKHIGVLSYLNSVVFGVFVWGLEGIAVTSVFNHFVSPADSWAAYLILTAVIEFSPVPFAVGLAELPLLIFESPAVFWLCALFHFFRIVPVLALSAVYITRYKFKISDFFNPRIIEFLHRYPEEDVPDYEEVDGAPDVSIVIPAYNEEQRLPSFMKDVLNYIKANQSRLSIEVLIVDDGSSDNTVKVVQEFECKNPNVRLLRQVRNQGKGAAVRRGMLEANGRYGLYADADGATPISELDKFIPFIEKSDKIVIGSRNISAGDVQQEREGLRSVMGAAFYKMVNFLAVPGIKDTQCGFKMYRRDIIHKIFTRSLENGWAFDVELLYLAQLMGHSIVEVPVNWHEVEGSKISPVKDALKMLAAVFRIRSRQGGFLSDS